MAKPELKNKPMTKDNIFEKEKKPAVVKTDNEKKIDVIFLKDGYMSWSGKSFKKDEIDSISESDFKKLSTTNHVKEKEK